MKLAVGLSGGVDSCVAALLLKRAGHDVTGVTMSIWRAGRLRHENYNACFGPKERDSIAAAAAFAKKIGIEHLVLDCADEYEKSVLDYFRAEKEAGRTPNPCVVCNRLMKFGLLPHAAARKIAFERFATGHYARRVELAGGRLAIARAKDLRKDQSYFLWRLTQEQIALAMFPLAELEKSEVRDIARKAGLEAAEKTDSQDFYRGDCSELIGKRDAPGEIVTTAGKVLGRHNGSWHYTVGQRQGLGIGGGTPFYVVATDPAANRVIVGTRDEAISTSFAIEGMNWMALEPTTKPVEAFVKIRSTGEPAGPVVIEDGMVRAPQGLFGVAGGQSAVFYESSGVILCGGTIVK